MKKLLVYVSILAGVVLMAGCTGLLTKIDKGEDSDSINENMLDGDGYDAVEVENADSNSDGSFIDGLTKKSGLYDVWADDENDGMDFNYISNGLKYKVHVYFAQVQVGFLVVEEGSTSGQMLEYESVLEEDGYDCRNKYMMGQYDFDKDGQDELVVGAIQTNEESNLFENIAILVYRLSGGSWNLIGKLEQNVVSAPKAVIDDNTITIDRHLRGFYSQLTMGEDGVMEDTSEY